MTRKEMKIADMNLYISGAMVQPLPTSYLIFRAASQAAGKCWMDALELSLRCSALLIRSVSNNLTLEDTPDASAAVTDTQWSEADYEKHFNEHGKLVFCKITGKRFVGD